MSRQLKKYVTDEYNDYVIYNALAKVERDASRREILYALSQKEYEHYLFWYQLSNHKPDSPSRAKIWLLLAARRLLGLIFVARLLERHERSVVKWYRALYETLPTKEKETLFHIIREEEEHEKALIGQIQERIVQYLGYVALGLSDSIIEISGVHAGFLGATSVTMFAGVAGMVVGFAASISMGVASYIQAKQMSAIIPLRAATVTGLSYIVSVILQALPFFLTTDIVLAFTSSITISLLLITGFTYYGVVLRDIDSRKEIVTNVLLTLGTAAATYVFGEMISSWLGLKSLHGLFKS
ncbi:MAG: rubrerythrin family protein [Nitrososphaerota archaeon]